MVGPPNMFDSASETAAWTPSCGTAATKGRSHVDLRFRSNAQRSAAKLWLSSFDGFQLPVISPTVPTALIDTKRPSSDFVSRSLTSEDSYSRSQC